MPDPGRSLLLTTELLGALSDEEPLRRELARCVAGKNAHDLRRLGAERALPEAELERLCACLSVYGPVGESLRRLRTDRSRARGFRETSLFR